MRLVEVLISRSEHHTIRKLIVAWEIPVLQYEYGPEKIEIHGFKRDKRPYPEAATEYERLSIRYGVDVENGQTKAALSYGQGAMGVTAIRNLMDAEKKTEAEEGDALELVDDLQNVVLNPEQDVIDAARAAILAKPGEGTAEKSTDSGLVQALMEQNKLLLELLGKQGVVPVHEGTPVPTPAKTLSLPKAKDAA